MGCQRKPEGKILEILISAIGLSYRLSSNSGVFIKKFFQQIVGVVRGVTHNGVTEIGPIAVHPDYQGKGVGRQLMTTVESRAKGGKCTAGIVSCRTDVIPFFEHMGYEASSLKQHIKYLRSHLCHDLPNNGIN